MSGLRTPSSFLSMISKALSISSNGKVWVVMSVGSTRFISSTRRRRSFLCFVASACIRTLPSVHKEQGMEFRISHSVRETSSTVSQVGTIRSFAHILVTVSRCFVTIGAQCVAGKVTRIVFYRDPHSDGTRSCRSLSPETYQQMAALHPVQRISQRRLQQSCGLTQMWHHSSQDMLCWEMAAKLLNRPTQDNRSLPYQVGISLFVCLYGRRTCERKNVCSL